MRRLLLLTGLLLFPLSASAAALSPWVDAVLSRSQGGIAAAESVPASTCPGGEADAQEITNTLSKIRSFVSTTMDLAAQSQFLGQETVCLSSDRFLLEEKLRMIENALAAAAQSCNAQALGILRADFDFLAGAYISFLQGAGNPSFADARLRSVYLFDGPAFVPDALAPLCPYTTDYSPHSIGRSPSPIGRGARGEGSSALRSYGCDATIITGIIHRTDLPDDLRQEAGAELAFLEETTTLASDLYTLVRDSNTAIERTIALLTGHSLPALPTAPASAPPHDQASGCLRPPSPEGGETAEQNPLDALFAFPDLFDAKYLRDSPLTSVPTYNPPPEQTLPEGVLLRSRNTFFSLLPDPMMLESFFVRKNEFGRERPLLKALIGSAFDPFADMTSALHARNSVDEMQFIAGNIEQGMGTLEATSRDAYERTLSAAEPLASAVRSLATVTDKDLPQYIAGLTYFLGRSCVDGHCQKTLDAVAQRIFNPFCHPYVSGKYTDEKAVQKCFCTDEFRNEDFCKGQLDLSAQPEAQMLCGEPQGE